MRFLKKIFKLRSSKEAALPPIIRLATTESTNDFFQTYEPAAGEDMTVVVADYQIHGRGNGKNRWESEPNKNLLMSILLHPSMVPVGSQFLLSEYGALCVKEALSSFLPDHLSLKWPNDVYWKDQKLCGILIETKLSGGRIKDCVFGIGINVNQTIFESDAPNPVSLAQILGYEIDKEELLKKLIRVFRNNYELIRSGDYGLISALYHEALYRGKGFYPYEDADGVFEGAIVEVEDDGTLILRDREGKIRTYKFKEIKYGKV